MSAKPHLTHAEEAYIYKHRYDMTMHDIAEELGRDTSTISAYMKRNGITISRYRR